MHPSPLAVKSSTNWSEQLNISVYGLSWIGRRVFFNSPTRKKSEYTVYQPMVRGSKIYGKKPEITRFHGFPPKLWWHSLDLSFWWGAFRRYHRHCGAWHLKRLGPLAWCNFVAGPRGATVPRLVILWPKTSWKKHSWNVSVNNRNVIECMYGIILHLHTFMVCFFFTNDELKLCFLAAGFLAREVGNPLGPKHAPSQCSHSLRDPSQVGKRN